MVEPAGTLQPLWRALELLGAATSIATAGPPTAKSRPCRIP